MEERGSVLALLERVRAGDSVAVHLLYEEVSPFLRAVARRVLTTADRRHADSEDVAASAFRRVVTGSMRARFESEAKALAWMAAIARNRVRNLGRRSRAPGGGPWEPADEAVVARSRWSDPAARAEDAEEVVLFRAAFETLLPAEREAVALRDFEGLSFEEVARRMGRPGADAARKLRARDRALSRLRSALRPEPPRRSR